MLACLFVVTKMAQPTAHTAVGSFHFHISRFRESADPL